VTDPENVVRLPATVIANDEQLLRRVRDEADRLANQPEVERTFFLPKRAEEIGVPVKVLKTAVVAILRDRADRVAAEHYEQQRERDQREQERLAAERERKRFVREAEKEEERERKRLAKEAEREQQRAKSEAERKSKEKSKGFATIILFPVARHEKELRRLAERLGEDLQTLRDEFKHFLGVEGDTASVEETKPWPRPVKTATLLQELGTKIAKHVVVQPHQLTAAVLWTAHTWLYDHDVPTHSPLLATTSAEPESGKSTTVAVAGRATPRYSLNIEMTGPSLYRYVDAVKPTLVIDEADDLFSRRSDLKHIINAGWTRGAKIPRQVNIGGVWMTVYFDPFTPKAISLLGRNLPPATRSRCIELRMLPKRADEKAEPFNQLDDAEFAVLRRKAARWAADNAAVLKDAKPTMPPGLNNRAAANWKLLLAIAELAGGPWPRQACEAAVRLTRSGRRPSSRVLLLAAFKAIFATGRKEVTSEAVVATLTADPTSVWADFNHGGPVTQRQVASLLDDFDIHPIPLHPTRRGDFARRGYKAAQFIDVFARYLPRDPIIRSPSRKRTARKLET
jgi:putative DNA primase/helicase